MEFLVVPAGLVTGIVLELFGSSGSILTLSALMYLLGVETKPAIAMSLGVGSEGAFADPPPLLGWGQCQPLRPGPRRACGQLLRVLLAQKD